MSRATTDTPPAEDWLRASGAGLVFRRAGADDLPFLLQVYASTRLPEVAALAWSEEQKTHFLAMQAHAQDTDYARRFPLAERWVIEQGARGVGRLYLDRREAANHILDIALLPEARGRGWGGAVLADLIDEAAAAGKAVTIYVESFNPARRLYERLGFRQVEASAPYLLMRRDTAVN